MNRRGATLLLVVCLLALASPGLADYDDALRAFERGQDAVALRELAPLVKAGSPSALFLLGAMREAGRGGAKDPAGAARLYRQAAEGGNTPAMTALGLLYYRGEGVAQSDAMASTYFRKAAGKGSAQALYLLGLMRLSGRGGPTADAVGYLRRAVRAGSPEAAAVLGELLLTGRGVVRNPAAAYAMALDALAGDRIVAATRDRLTALAERAGKALDPTVALRIEGKARGQQGTDRGHGDGPGAAPKGPVITGTGFVVSRLGHVLTNAHVAAHCRRLMAVVDGKPMGASLLRADPEHAGFSRGRRTPGRHARLCRRVSGAGGPVRPPAGHRRSDPGTGPGRGAGPGAGRDGRGVARQQRRSAPRRRRPCGWRGGGPARYRRRAALGR